MKTSLCLFVFLGIATQALAGEGAGSSVPHLTEADFDEKTGDGKVWFVKLYAPWCGHCKKMAPAWAELAESLAGNPDIAVASVDCTQQKAVCDKADVKGFPTLRIFYGGEAKQVYSGPRRALELKAFIEEQKHLLVDQTTE